MFQHIACRAGAALLAVGLVAADAHAQTRGFQPEDYYALKTAGEVAISPAGDLVAYTVTTIVEAENRRHREIWLQPLESGRPAGPPVRATAPTEESSGPRFSPDGRVLAFQSRRGDDPNATWFLRLDGPGGEAYHIEGVEGSPVWSPDGTRIAYTRVPDPEEPRGKRAGWIAPDAVSKTLDPERFDGHVITSMQYRRDGRSGLLPHPSTDGKRQLYVVAADGGEPMAVTRTAYDVGAPTWSSDGLHLYFAGDESEDDEFASGPSGDLWVVAAAGGGVRPLTRAEGAERGPSVSPDGTRIAYVATPAQGAETDVLVAELGSDGHLAGEPMNITESWSLDPGDLQWSPDGLRVLWTARVGGDVHLFSAPASGGEVTQVTRGDRQLRDVSFSADHTVMAYAATDVTTPMELYVARGDGTGEVRASHLNDAWLSGIDLMEAERITWTVEDGTLVEGWAMKPVGFDPARRYPLILKIHGGPHSAYGNTFFPTFHVLSAAGFFVLYTNPRGSDGYGNAFKYATREAWGIVDREDYLSGVDAALARYPEIDPERVGVSGGSYGGFMSNWLTATTDRFAASVTSRSISNWESWWGTSDVPGLTEYEFGGTPWERRDLYRRLSPISYVENVTAPTLIIHSEEDYRTPMADAEQWYLSLKKRQVPTELVRYPRSSHGLSRTGEPWLLVDRLERIRSWFAHFLLQNEAVTAAP